MSACATQPAFRLGPAICGTLTTSAVDVAIDAYRKGLGLAVVADSPLPAATAAAWGRPELAGRRCVRLGADAEDQSTHWLRILDMPAAVAPAPMHHAGWLALEVLVRDVHDIARRIDGNGFTVLGEPRPLAVSDSIWAMQVAGPAGETLYLTEVRAAVPPFDLPAPARLHAERLFIPVLSAACRDDALGYYENLNGNSGLRFETRVSALNTALGLEPERQRPVGTLQLGGACLIEIDEVPEHRPSPVSEAGLPAGLAMVSLAAAPDTPLPAGVAWHDGIALLRGAAGEWIELLAR